MERHHNTMTSPPPKPTPTTFVQADTNTFRDLVQKLTGLSGDSDELQVTPLPTRLSPKVPGTDPTGPRRSPFKLQERRHTMRNLEIKLGTLTTLRHAPPTTHYSPRQSPVTPLGSDSPFFPSSGSQSPSSPAVLEEEKAIAEKTFFLHPSPLSTPRVSEPPELLSLFPLSSPSQRNRD